jgi:hypothetical protein
MMTDTFVHGFLRQLFKTWTDGDGGVGNRAAVAVGVPPRPAVYVGPTEAANLPNELADGLTRLAVLKGDRFDFQTREELESSGREVYLVWLDPHLTLERWDRCDDGFVVRHVLPVSLTPFPGSVSVCPETGRIVSTAATAAGETKNAPGGPSGFLY